MGLRLVWWSAPSRMKPTWTATARRVSLWLCENLQEDEGDGQPKVQDIKCGCSGF